MKLSRRCAPRHDGAGYFFQVSTLSFVYATLTGMQKRGGELGMQKPMSKSALEKEAAYWNAVKEQAKTKTGMVCHK
jgi:hypothetical protein